MKAVVRERYGTPGVLHVAEIDKPVPADDELLVRIHATSVNPVDWHTLTGIPHMVRLSAGLVRPKGRLGVDFAGTVEAVGNDVTLYRTGDEVFGGRNGSFAEFVCVRESRAVVLKPPNVTFEQAAAVPVAALTALQGLRDKGQIRPGHSVLVNGASGGVGTFAVQIAKAFDAEVTAVCGTRNVDLVRSLGADHVIDYTHEDFSRGDRRYDLILDIAGDRSWREYRRVLTPHATVVIVGGPKTNRWIGPFAHLVAVRLAALPGGRKATFFIASFNKADMEALRELLEAGKITPAIDRRYQLDDLADALAYLGDGHANAKVVVAV